MIEINNQLINVSEQLSTSKNKSATAISEILNLSKGSVKRRLKKLQSREHHPCSVSFETTAGLKWLNLLVILTIFYFGIKSNVGARVISEFLYMLGVGLYIGVSSGSIKRTEQKMDGVIASFGIEQDLNFAELSKNIEIHAAGDETYFNRFNILVFMDLVSGFILKEEIKSDRKLNTWKNTVSDLINKFKKFSCLISDGSNVLKGLSKKLLKCVHFSDLFHMQNYYSSVMRFQFHSKIKSIDKKLLSCDKEGINQLITEKNVLLKGQHDFRQQLHDVSVVVHPFSSKNSKVKDTLQTETELNNSYSILDKIKSECKLTDKKKKLTTFKNQIPFAAAQINEWWNWAKTSLLQFNVGAELQTWLLEYFLPVVYWKAQVHKCRNDSVKKTYNTVLGIAKEKLSQHPLTPRISESDEYSKWISWAKWITNQFQRTTSAVEGRNGVLALASHFCRGITEARLNSLTVIHNYFIKRNDNTTAAERLYKMKHHSLLEYVIENMEELPLPRSRKNEQLRKSLYLQCIAA